MKNASSMLPRSLSLLLSAVALAALSACGGGDDSSTAVSFKTLNGAAPLVIGHRGASGELPEHTLESYERAIARGADYIEPDLVLTRDGVMIARHEPMLDGTTDVADKFDASRKTIKLVDGVSTSAYFASDFTLAEIKTLRAKQSNAGRSQAFNGLYQIPTLAEVINVAQTRGAAAGRTVGIYPEIKHSTFHEGLFGAKVFEDKLLATLHPIYGNVATAPVFIQSFEVSNLQYLRTKTKIKLVQLIDADDVNKDGSLSLVAPYAQPYDFVVKGDARKFSDLLTSTGLDFVKTYADAVSPWKPYLVKTVDDGVERTGDTTLTLNDRRVDGSTGVIEMAHAKGLLVHGYTFRNDASGYGFKDPQAEMTYYMKLGIDALFTDFPGTGVAARNDVK